MQTLAVKESAKTDIAVMEDWLTGLLQSNDDEVFKVWIAKKKGDDFQQFDVRSDEGGTEFAKNWLIENSDFDLYYSPTRFKNSFSKKREQGQAFIANYIWLDIDGVPECANGEEAWEKLIYYCEKFDLPHPNYVFCTSESTLDFPTYVTDREPPRLQALWSIKGFVTSYKGKKLWQSTSNAVVDVFKQTDLKIDEKASRNLIGFLRFPGSFNSKSETLVRRVGPSSEQIVRLDELLQAAKFYQPEKPKYSTPVGLRKRTNGILDLPHFQILAKGVPDGCRNGALYALAKALWNDGFNEGEAVQWCLEWNKRCSPPEDESKVRGVVKSCFNERPDRRKGIDPARVAEIVSDICGKECKPDARIIKLQRPLKPLSSAKVQNSSKTKAKKRKSAVANHAEKIMGAHPLTPGTILTNGEMAKLAGCSEETIRKNAKKIREYIAQKKHIHFARRSNGYEIIDKALLN